MSKPIEEKRPIPENFLYMAQHANTPQARKWWGNYCDRYARGEV